MDRINYLADLPGGAIPFLSAGFGLLFVHYKPMIRLANFLKFSLFTTLISFISSLQAHAQMQRGIPKPRGPVDLSDTSNLVIFIILPILVIIGYFFWRKAVKKRREKEDNQG